jgi:hypothetical protein
MTKKQLLYFLPDRPQRREITEKLPGRFSGQITTRQTIRGPLDFPAGFLIAENDNRLELKVQEQTWIKSGDESFAFGYWNDERPTPEDLIAAEVVAGSMVDGWLVPRARKQHLMGDQILWSVALPKKPRWNGSRFVSGDVCDRFAHVAELADTVAKALETAYSTEDDVCRLPDDAANLAAQILQINYRLGCDELAHFEAFEMSFASIAAILRVFVSWDIFEELLQAELQKKTAAS